MGSLDLQRVMLRVVESHNISMTEFWKMPLFVVMELLGVYAPPESKSMSRKTLIDHERAWNKRKGIA